MGIDLQLLQEGKGGDPELVRESQRRRHAAPELVDDVLSLYRAWVNGEHPARLLSCSQHPS